MKVSELFAEIGFKVDTKGLDEFSKSMKGIQETIKSCVSGLKEFAKAAEQINRSVQNIKNAYVPTQKEASQRYRAETYYFRSAGKELRGRSIMEKGKGALFQINADLREEQEDRLKKQANTNRERLELQKLNYILNREKFDYRKEHQTDVSGAVTIGTIIGNIVSRALHTLLSSLKGFFSGIFSFVRDTIRAAMAYRDYQSFTGRSVNELSGLMGMTAYTTNMTPKDILKDAQSMQKNYWDMWFGRSSPEFWMTIGALPTGNGARDLRTALSSIYNATNKGQNTGMAMSLLSLAGLDEQYMNIFKAMREGRENEFMVMEDEIKAMSNANDSLNKFRIAVDEAKMAIVNLLLKDGGLKEVLDYLLSFLKAIVVLLRSGAFKGKSFTESLDMTYNALQSGKGALSYMANTGKYIQNPKMTFGEKVKISLAEIVGLGMRLSEKDLSDIQNDVLSDFKRRQREYAEQINMFNGTINNNFDFSGKTPEEAAEYSASITAKEMYLGQREMNNTDATLQTAYAY